MDLSKLAANGTAEPDAVRRAFRDLRRLVRLGRMAEAALSRIREKGWADGKFPAAGHDRYKSLDVRSYYLEAVRTPTRDMVPAFADLTVSLGKPITGSHGGTEFKEVPLWLSGTGFAQLNREVVPRQVGERLGSLRLKKDGGITYESKQSKVVKLYSEFKSEKSLQSASAFADDFTAALGGCDDASPSQLYNDLMEQVPEWLIGEGHVRRLCLEARDAARVLGVMSS